MKQKINGKEVTFRQMGFEEFFEFDKKLDEAGDDELKQNLLLIEYSQKDLSVEEIKSLPFREALRAAKFANIVNGFDSEEAKKNSQANPTD